LGEERVPLAWFSKDLFVDAAKRRGLTGFWLKQCRIRDVSNFAYAKRKCVGGFFGKWDGFGFGGVYWFVCDIRWVLGVVVWPNANANSLLIPYRDFEFGVSDEGVEGLVPLDEEPGVVDKFKG
jgi:hypothetical protein